MPRINLLPWRAAERKRRQQQFAVAAAVAIAAACAVTGLLYLMMSGWIEGQREKNQLLKTEIAALDKQIEQIKGLEAERNRLIARKEVIEILQRSRPEVVHLFDQLVRTLPDGVYLTSVKQDNRRLTITGITQSSTRVATFMEQIDKSEWLEDAELAVVESKGRDAAQGSEFIIYANQVGVTLPGETPEGGAK
jgi:type IV pilus assembly protein PilN